MQIILRKIKISLPIIFFVDAKEMSENELSKKNFYQSCHKIFRAFLLWLEEPRLQENNFLLRDLPSQYEPKSLTLIIQGSTVSMDTLTFVLFNQFIS